MAATHSGSEVVGNLEGDTVELEFVTKSATVGDTSIKEVSSIHKVTSSRFLFFVQQCTLTLTNKT